MDIVKGGANIEVSVDKSPRNVSHTKNIKLYPSISPFPPLESDEIIKGLDLVYVAKNLAWKEEPSSDSKLRSVQELQIDNYYPDAVAKYNQILKAGIDNKTKEIEKLADDVKQNDNNARNIPKMFDIEGQKILDQYEHFFEKEKKNLKLLKSNSMISEKKIILQGLLENLEINMTNYIPSLCFYFL